MSTAISEREAARRLNIPAPTLTMWRREGKLAGSSVLTTLDRPPRKGQTMKPIGYDADQVDAIAAGERELFPAELTN